MLYRHFKCVNQVLRFQCYIDYVVHSPPGKINVLISFVLTTKSLCCVVDLIGHGSIS
jgi:hypothetical protein